MSGRPPARWRTSVVTPSSSRVDRHVEPNAIGTRTGTLPRCSVRFLHPAHGGRYGVRHRRVDCRARVRAVLHDERQGQRHGARPVDHARHRHTTAQPHRRGEPHRRRHALSRVPAAPPRRGATSTMSSAPAACWRTASTSSRSRSRSRRSPARSGTGWIADGHSGPAQPRAGVPQERDARSLASSATAETASVGPCCAGRNCHPARCSR